MNRLIASTLILITIVCFIGCKDSDFKQDIMKQVTELNPQTEKLQMQAGFLAGWNNCRCQDIKDHPQNFKPGAWNRLKDMCEKFKDFETFYELYNNGGFDK